MGYNVIDIEYIMDIMDIAYIVDIIISHGDYEKSQLRILELHRTFHKDQNVWSMRNQIVGERVSWENANLHRWRFGAPQKW